MDTSFVEELASAAPTPGGGGASAYCGALACALASMVGNLTVGKKTYAQVESEVYMRLEKLADLRGRLLSLVGADAEAFGQAGGDSGRSCRRHRGAAGYHAHGGGVRGTRRFPGASR